MNKKFKTNIINIYGLDGKQWLDNLPKIVELISKEWHLIGLKPVDNLSMNYVTAGFQKAQEIVLKLSFDPGLIERERTALEALVGYGAVEVLAYKEKTLSCIH